MALPDKAKSMGIQFVLTLPSSIDAISMQRTMQLMGWRKFQVQAQFPSICNNISPLFTTSLRL
jgi:hypothetical protein